MITPTLYETLDQAERRLWHSHVFEVKSGMLVMPQPSALVPQAAWEQAEHAETEEVIKLYGKVYHLWQVDRGDKLPLGEPQLMTSITAAEQVPRLEDKMDERDARFDSGVDWRRKRELRKDLQEMEVHPGTTSPAALPCFAGMLIRLGCRCRLYMEEEVNASRLAAANSALIAVVRRQPTFNLDTDHAQHQLAKACWQSGLMRKTRNLVPSGASVRIRPKSSSIFFFRSMWRQWIFLALRISSRRDVTSLLWVAITIPPYTTQSQASVV